MLLSAVIAFVLAMLLSVPASAASGRTKEIHIVYDDSGSMAVGGNTSWSQAKYALEVFTAMLGPNDTLTIYPMSSFSYKGDSDEKSSSWGEKIVIRGDTPVSERVAQVAGMNGAEGEYLNTPIAAVTAAGEELAPIQADEKWLVILTDGKVTDGKVFDNGKDSGKLPTEETDQEILRFAGKDGISCIYVAIGENAYSMDSYEGTPMFYIYKAGEGQILNTVTEVARTVYTLQQISYSGDADKVFTPDIPMSKIIIFSQGESTDVSDLSSSGGDFHASPETVHVGIAKDDPIRPIKYENVTVADGLNGIVQTYHSEENAPFASGEYRFSSNASTTEIYFEPGVNVVTCLQDQSGTETVLSGAQGVAGAGLQNIFVKIINPLTGEYIDPAASPMLEGVELSAIITDPSGSTMEYANGDPIELAEGKYLFASKARFRGDVEKTSESSEITVKSRDLTVAFQSDASLTFTAAGISSDDGIRFTVKDASGELLTDEEYASISFPEITGPSGLDWSSVTAEDEKGLYSIHPAIQADQADPSAIGQAGDVSVSAVVSAGGITRTGGASVPCSFSVGIGARAQLTDQEGNVYEVGEDQEEMEAGDYTISLIYTDGKDDLSDEDVSLSSILQRAAVITDESGAQAAFMNADTVTLAEGIYQIQTAVTCGEAEPWVGDPCSLAIARGILRIEFDQDGGYTYNLTDLSSESGVAFTVTDSSGKMLTEEEMNSLQFTDISGPEGVDWSEITPDGEGVFRVSPKLAEGTDGFGSLSGEDGTLAITAVSSVNGVQKAGSGSTKIRWTASEVPIELELICPKEEVRKGKKRYMFDPDVRGVKEGSPYILVKAYVRTGDDTSRPLTEQEWKKADLAYSTKPYQQNLIWQAVGFLSRLSLEFKIVPGDEASTYKMYLDGLTTTGVRPNASSLDVRIKVKLDNGITETGESSTVVTVKPVMVMAYIGRFVIALLIIVLILTFLIMELRKNRFDRAMCPCTTSVLSENGISKTPPPPRISKKRIQYKIWPPLKAEERKIILSFDEPRVQPIHISFTVKAVEGKAFVIKDVARFQTVKSMVTFDGVKYNDMVKMPIHMTLDSTIEINVRGTGKTGKVIMEFRDVRKRAARMR